MAAAGAPLAEPPAPRRRRLGWLLALLPAALLVALWLGPRFLDWEPWRDRIAELASNRLGRAVTLGGPITLTLLPQPLLEAGAVAIGAAEDGLTVTARALRLRLALPALLAGRIEPRALTLVGGDITLPWPPHNLPDFMPPPWLTELDARLEDCRVTLGGARLEGLDARLVTSGVSEALIVEGSFAWRGTPLRFNGQLGRPGPDGVAPLDVSLQAAGATLSAHGVLAPAGGFEGRMDAAGPDLSAWLPAPPGAFRASGKFTATTDLFAADGVTLDLAGEPARGAITLRLAPEPRLDVALAAGRLDLEAWIAALRQARAGPAARAVPLSMDLSAEVASFGGIPLRRLRGGVALEGERLTVSDVVALLPGETLVELSGATAGDRLELAVHGTAQALRETLAAVGWLPPGLDPARLRRAEARLKLVLQGNEATVADLTGTLDGMRFTGAGVWRHTGRPMLSGSFAVDRLDLAGLLPDLPDTTALAGFDLALRLAADRLVWRDLAADGGALDLGLDSGRLAVRRLALRVGTAELTGGAVATFGGGLKLADLTLEANGPDGQAIGALLPPAWAPLRAILADKLALRLTGGGPSEALALRLEGELGDLRLDSAGTFDAPQLRGTMALTLRHPGAARLLTPLLGAGVEAWFGQGSFAVIANLSGTPRAITAEHLDLVAGGLRGRGRMTLARDGRLPRITGRFAADTLPLPSLAWRDPTPLGLDRLGLLEAELQLDAARVELAGRALLEDAAATLKLSDATLRVEALQARLAGGTLRGSLSIAGGAVPPRLALDATLGDAGLAGPLFGLPFDVSAGRVEASAKLTASGHGPAALLATLTGPVEFDLRDGVLVGLDLGALLAAAVLPDPVAEPGLRQATAGGATAFERLQGTLVLAEGRARLGTTTLTTEGGGAALVAGGFDVARGTLDLRLATRPLAEAPEIALRLTGAAAAPRRLAELSPFLRWRAER